jgi:ketosteroid isomerase-like protein
VSQNVEIVRRGVEAAIRRPKPDFATVNELYHPDHVLISRMNAIEGGSHIGARGYRDWLLSSRDAVEWEQRLDQVTEIDKNRVLAITPGSIRGKSSGIALEEEWWASVVTVRGGKIIRTEVYSSPEEALKAVGVG